MNDDFEIQEWIQQMIDNNTNNINDNNEFDENNDNDDNDDIFTLSEPKNTIDTAAQAKMLLASWAQDTKTFSSLENPPLEDFGLRNQTQLLQNNHQNNHQKNHQNNHQKKPSKIAKYKKLDAPMMVAKKAEPIKVVDPTANSEARRALLNQKKAERLKRQEEKQIQPISPTHSPIKQVDYDIPIPDIDDEIRQHRAKVNDLLKQKQNEIQIRQKKAAIVRQLDTTSDDNNLRSSLVTSSLKKQSNPKNKLKQAPSKINNKNIMNNNNNNQNNNNHRNFNGNNFNMKNNNSISEMDKNKTEELTPEQLKMEKMRELEALRIRIHLFDHDNNIRKKRAFFSKWISDCSFNSQSYKKATMISSYRIKSSFFGKWKSKYKKVIEERENFLFQQNIKLENQKIRMAKELHIRIIYHQVLGRWKMIFKAAEEFHRAQNEKKKRKELLIITNAHSKNESNQVSNFPSHPNQRNNNNNTHVPQSPHSPHSPNSLNSQTSNQFGSPNSQHSPGKNPNFSPKKPLKIPKAKIEDIKVDPKMVAMEKRMEEERIKKLEKIKQKYEEERKAKEDQENQKLEEAMLKRKEHIKKLERSKIGRRKSTKSNTKTKMV